MRDINQAKTGVTQNNMNTDKIGFPWPSHMHMQQHIIVNISIMVNNSYSRQLSYQVACKFLAICTFCYKVTTMYEWAQHDSNEAYMTLYEYKVSGFAQQFQIMQLGNEEITNYLIATCYLTQFL